MNRPSSSTVASVLGRITFALGCDGPNSPIPIGCPSSVTVIAAPVRVLTTRPRINPPSIIVSFSSTVSPDDAVLVRHGDAHPIRRRCRHVVSPLRHDDLKLPVGAGFRELLSDLVRGRRRQSSNACCFATPDASVPASPALRRRLAASSRPIATPVTRQPRGSVSDDVGRLRPQVELRRREVRMHDVDADVDPRPDLARVIRNPFDRESTVSVGRRPQHVGQRPSAVGQRHDPCARRLADPARPRRGPTP